MADAPKLKDYFTAEVISETGERLRAVHPPFDVDQFVVTSLGDAWDDLTFTERSRRIADGIWAGIDLDVVDTLGVLTAALPSELDDPEGVLNEGFWLWPFGDAIAAYAVDELDAGLDACEQLTKRFTSEFAVRPFLARYPEAMDRVRAWANHESEHVRRLASEGTRPRLPWATRLDLPVDRVLEVLSALRADESLYVRRSVANHLNDLAKADSDRIVSLLEEWHAEGVEETSWIVRHAMRNHLKNGDPRVLALFGYGAAMVELSPLRIEPASVAIGETVSIEFDVTSASTEDQQLMIDLVVGYVKANGSIGPKVFKFKDTTLGAGETLACRKRLDMVVRSTRKLYAGEHTVTVRVNGADLASATFDLAT